MTAHFNGDGKEFHTECPQCYGTGVWLENVNQDKEDTRPIWVEHGCSQCQGFGYI